ncbi:MAG: hypothetical protein WCX74_04450 [Candidatus Paceibacterota bacterium]
MKSIESYAFCVAKTIDKIEALCYKISIRKFSKDFPKIVNTSFKGITLDK